MALQTSWKLSPLLQYASDNVAPDNDTSLNVDNCLSAQPLTHVPSNSIVSQSAPLFDSIHEQDLDCVSVAANLSTPVCTVSSPSMGNSADDHVPSASPQTETPFLES